MITKISGNIPDHEYYLDDDLRGEIILENTKRIGQYAFHFTTIEQINLENIEYIGGSAFEYTKIKKANLENIYHLMSSVFANCEELLEVTIGNKLLSIGYGCFNNCPNLKKINLPDTLKTIERNAFKNSGITNLLIPPLVKILAEGTFCNCRNLEYINLGNIEKISSNAIANTALEEIELPNSIKILDTKSIKENKKLKKIIIPTTIEEIKQDALVGNWALEEIIFKGNKSELSKIKGFDKFYEEYSDIIKIEKLTLDDILKNMHNHKRYETNKIEQEHTYCF